MLLSSTNITGEAACVLSSRGCLKRGNQAAYTVLGLEKQALWGHGTLGRTESDNGTHSCDCFMGTRAREHGVSGRTEPYNGPVGAVLKAAGAGALQYGARLWPRPPGHPAPGQPPHQARSVRGPGPGPAGPRYRAAPPDPPGRPATAGRGRPRGRPSAGRGGAGLELPGQVRAAAARSGAERSRAEPGGEIQDCAYLDSEGAYSESELFPDDDTMTLAQQEVHHESDMDSAIESAQSSEASDVCRIEEKDGVLGGLFLPGDNAGQTPRKMRHVYNSELLDVYCSQCCKKINLLNDLEARLKNLKANSPNRKISSTAFGRQLFHNSNFSSSNGSTEDLFRDSIDSCDNDITEKVTYLEKKVTELENDSLTNGDLKSKLKQENTQLVHRVHELEELLKDQETSAEQTLEEEIKRHREAYSKYEKEKGTEIELLNTRVQQLEDENGELKSTVTRLKSQTERLDEERQRMSDRLEDTSLRLKDEMDLYKRMMDKLRQNRLEFNKEREATQELIEDLRKELEHLQLYKLECERPGRGRSSSSSVSEFNAKTREVEMEHEIKRLKQENQKLRDQNDDLNGQILSLSLYEAKNLFATQTKAQSLAAEIDSASRDELMEALKEQEEINYRLRQYMDKIILAILDHNPSILEIKN